MSVEVQAQMSPSLFHRRVRGAHDTLAMTDTSDYANPLAWFALVAVPALL